MLAQMIRRLSIVDLNAAWRPLAHHDAASLNASWQDWAEHEMEKRYASLH
jgi:hypothetical protein